MLANAPNLNFIETFELGPEFCDTTRQALSVVIPSSSERAEDVMKSVQSEFQAGCEGFLRS